MTPLHLHGPLVSSPGSTMLAAAVDGPLIVLAALLTVVVVIGLGGLVWAEHRQSLYRNRLRAANVARRAIADPETTAGEQLHDAATARLMDGTYGPPLDQLHEYHERETQLIAERRARPKPSRTYVLTDVRPIRRDNA